MTAKGAETIACTTAIEIVRCECGAAMRWTHKSENRGPGGSWKHHHRCMRVECDKQDWLDKKFPRLLVYDDTGWGGNDPMFVINPDRVGYE